MAFKTLKARRTARMRAHYAIQVVPNDDVKVYVGNDRSGGGNPENHFQYLREEDLDDLIRKLKKARKALAASRVPRQA